MTNPRLSYSVNRGIGLNGLNILNDANLESGIIIFLNEYLAGYTEEMRKLFPDTLKRG